MSSNNTSKAKPNFAFGTRELRHAAAQAAHSLAIEASGLKASGESRGSDPYNTSGSFDRKKHWERIGKR